MKKSIFAKALCLVLCCCLLGGMLAACGSGAEKRGDENQTEFLIVGGVSILSAGNDGNPVLVEMAEKAGVEIEWDLLSDSLNERVGLLIGGNQLPDAFIACNFSKSDLTEYGEDGTFIDLTEYITPEIMPNLSAILEAHPEIRTAITQADGKIYGLPSAEMMRTSAFSDEYDYSIYSIPEFSMINKKWLDDLGLDVPTNLTELHDGLVAFKEKDMAKKVYGNTQGTIPMCTAYDQWCYGQEIFYAGFGFTNFTSDVCADLLVDASGNPYFACATDAYRDAVTYFHDWFAEGLMDLEMFSQGESQIIAKTSAGRVGVAVWWEIEQIAGQYAKDYVFLPPLDGPVGTKYEGSHAVTLRDGGAVTSNNLNITSACGNPELLCKYFDQWYDSEAVMQLQYGPIGVYFSEKDANGVWQTLTDEQAMAQHGKSLGDLKNQYEVRGPKLILPEYYNSVFYMEDRAEVRLKQLINDWLPGIENKNFYPVDVNFTSEELGIISRYQPLFVSQVAEMEGRWLLDGGPSDADWNAYLDTLRDSCGMDRLLDVYQTAYARYVSAG